MKRETTKLISLALTYPSANTFQQSFLIYATANDIISRLQCCVFKEQIICLQLESSAICRAMRYFKQMRINKILPTIRRQQKANKFAQHERASSVQMYSGQKQFKGKEKFLGKKKKIPFSLLCRKPFSQQDLFFLSETVQLNFLHHTLNSVKTSWEPGRQDAYM